MSIETKVDQSIDVVAKAGEKAKHKAERAAEKAKHAAEKMAEKVKDAGHTIKDAVT